MYYTNYQSPLGILLLAADEVGVCGLWFAGQRYYAATLAEDAVEGETPILEAAEAWLDAYFRGVDPDPIPPVHLIGTEFQKSIWRILATIPYGETSTYGAIQKQVEVTRHARVSAQAVGTAVGRNPVSIIIPCHRVLNAGGQPSGYAAGLDKKAALLRLENPKNML